MSGWEAGSGARWEEPRGPPARRPRTTPNPQLLDGAESYPVLALPPAGPPPLEPAAMPEGELAESEDEGPAFYPGRSDWHTVLENLLETNQQLGCLQNRLATLEQEATQLAGAAADARRWAESVQLVVGNALHTLGSNVSPLMRR